MGTIADKLSYLNDTKTLLRRGINALGGALTTDDTFRSYANALDNIYDYLPKVTGTGTSVTLDGVRDGGLRINLNPTAISQTTYTGKNLFDGISEIGAIDSNGTNSINNNAWRTPSYIKVDGNSNYTLSIGTTISEVAGRIKYYDKSKTYLGLSTDRTITTNQVQITTPNNCSYIRFFMLSNIIPSTTNIQLEKGSTATSYEPYVGGTASPNPSYPQDIHTISGDNSVVVEGKNLFEIGTSASDYDKRNGAEANNIKGITNNTISVEITGQGGTYFYRKKNIIGNETYTLSSTFSIKQGRYFVRLRNNDNTGWLTNSDATISGWSYNSYYDGWYKEANNTSGNITITIPSCLYWNFGLGFATTTAGNIETITNIQIEKGSTATDYTPYVSQTKPINLGEYELGTIGNYSNEFVRSNGENIFSTDYKTTDTLTTYTKIDNNSYSYTCSGTWKGVTFVVPCEENTDYFINYNEHNPNNRGTYCEVKGGQTNTSLMARYHDYLITFNSGENTSLKITITNGTASDNTSGTITEIMLNKGTTALPYVPYEKGWYYKQGIGKATYNGSEEWTLIDTYNNIKQIQTREESSLYANDNYSRMLANYFQGVGFNNSWTKDNSITMVTNYIRVMSSQFETASDFKTWLNTHNLVVYWAMKTPTYTKITGELAEQLEQVYKGMLSYDGTTNISQVNNDLSFDFDITALKELEESEG